jgi:midasin
MTPLTPPFCRCVDHCEPVLLVGETGVGKTTVCQLLALMRGQRLHVLNCNQHTETADFLGGFRCGLSSLDES